MSRLALGLLLSAAAHGAVVLGVIGALGLAEPRTLFVDLVAGFGFATSGGGSGGGGSTGSPGPSDATAPRAATAPRRAPVATGAAPPASTTAPPVNRELPRVPEPPRVAAVPEPPHAGPPPEPALVSPSPEVTAPPRTPAAPEVILESAPSASATASSAGAANSAAAGAGTGEPARGSASDGGAPGAGGRDSDPRVGQGGSGTGGGLGAGAGTRQGSMVAAVPGDGAGVPPEYNGYYALVRSRIHDVLRYPGAARRRGLTGTVLLELEIAPTGVIGAATVVVSSSHALLDQEALEAVRRLGRVPFPPGLRPRQLRMRQPVEFNLTAQP